MQMLIQCGLIPEVLEPQCTACIGSNLDYAKGLMNNEQRLRVRLPQGARVFDLLCLQYHSLVPSLTEGANLRVCIIDGAARIFLPPPMPRLGIELTPVQLHLFIRNLIQEIPQLLLGEQTKKTELKIR